MEELDLGAMLRGLRRQADLSQRQLAARAGMSQAMVARIESGGCANPSFRTVERLVRAAGARFDCDAPGVEAVPHEERRDEADRHYPAHLDVRTVTDPKDWGAAWWAYVYPKLPRPLWPMRLPAATFDLCRDRRDRRRLREEARRCATIRRVEAWRWVAEMPDGTVVAELLASRRSGDVVLHGVLVARVRRSVGIGRRLIEALAGAAAEAGVSRIWAVTEPQHCHFLSRCGFRGREDMVRLVRGV